ncbi:type VI secretion system-associated protein TagF [Massilia sp. Leaf139]|uniref:type VI secretion system-associated protein TagF n=1 Tax=Massilia sp. Leaf139 TaxID=1736272 RepID=UPI0009EC4E0F|nr:type VI secretion system-associated protein TagF [Massilia sp. Leaf139]
MSARSQTTAPGFFGKLPSHGDFVARRMPPAVRHRFDAWLQEGLLQSRADLGEAWLPTWLSSPLWRFVAAPGVCGAQAWAGVMMPSHDRVGRCFPLLLAAAFDGAPSLLDVHAGWFEGLEALALSVLDEDFALDAFDAALMALGGPPSAAAHAPLHARAAGEPRVTLVDGGDRPGSGESAWWSEGSVQVAPCLAICAGLPPRHAFAALLDGRWAVHGWDDRRP